MPIYFFSNVELFCLQLLRSDKLFENFKSPTEEATAVADPNTTSAVEAEKIARVENDEKPSFRTLQSEDQRRPSVTVYQLEDSDHPDVKSIQNIVSNMKFSDP